MNREYTKGTLRPPKPAEDYWFEIDRKLSNVFVGAVIAAFVVAVVFLVYLRWYT